MNNVNLDRVQEKLFKETGDVSTWCEEQYNQVFAKYFNGLSEIYSKVTSDRTRITDEDLEWILTDIPLQLISVSEQLSQYKLNNECLKLYIKKEESEYISNSDASTVTQKRELASLHVMEYKILSSAYSAVISRVDNEINFCRELIMTAKKIWDARSKAYEGSPVAAVNNDLPEYRYGE